MNLTNHDRYYTKHAPTREAVLRELANILQERRNVPNPNYERIDPLQCAYDIVMELWPVGRELPA